MSANELWTQMREVWKQLHNEKDPRRGAELYQEFCELRKKYREITGNEL